MSDSAPDDPARDAAERRFVKDMLLGWALDRADIILSRLAEALLARDLGAAIQQLGLDHAQNALAALRNVLGAQRGASWADVVAQMPAAIRNLPGMQQSLAAAQVEDAAVGRIAQTLDLSRITAITADTRTALTDLIAQGLRDGVHPNLLAVQLRDALGVNRPQAAALGKYRARLMAQGRKADQIERVVAKKAQTYRNQRARTVARTEVARAQQEGARLQYQRMVANGIITASAYVVQYLTAEDEKVCPICGPIDGQQVPIGGLFVTTVGMVPGPPLHPNCRCVTRLTLAPPTAPVYRALRTGNVAT